MISGKLENSSFSIIQFQTINNENHSQISYVFSGNGLNSSSISRNHKAKDNVDVQYKRTTGQQETKNILGIWIYVILGYWAIK